MGNTGSQEEQSNELGPSTCMGASPAADRRATTTDSPLLQELKFNAFPTRSRSVVHSTKGIVSTTSPQATEAGLRILRARGNAADAAVAMAAVLNVVDPAMTGIGGDMFCLYHAAHSKVTNAVNGSGHSPLGATLEQITSIVRAQDPEADQIPSKSVHAVTIPGAARGWIETVERFGSGRVSLEEILRPAIEMAEDGVPVGGIAAHMWTAAEPNLLSRGESSFEVLKRDPNHVRGYRAPREGELILNPKLAKTFHILATERLAGFYEGVIGERIVSTLQGLGGFHSLDDLAYQAYRAPGESMPLSIRLLDEQQEPPVEVDVWEHAPNSQGIVALMALGIIRELETAGQIPAIGSMDFLSARYLHVVIESLRIAFADAAWYVTDPQKSELDFRSLLSKSYLAERARLFNPSTAARFLEHGSPAFSASDTVYMAAVDSEGNACSLINSVCDSFGSCIVPPGTGFALQNRGTGFWLDPNHPNVYAPRKRPYHTIIPGMVTNLDGSLHTVLGVMGGAMQPQGHVQVLMNMLKFKLNVQEALDAPRVCVTIALPGKRLESTYFGGGKVLLEQGIPEAVAEELQRMGHTVEVVRGYARSVFGRGQIIRAGHDPVTGQRVYSAGSDGRGDGVAAPL